MDSLRLYWLEGLIFCFTLALILNLTQRMWNAFSKPKEAIAPVYIENHVETIKLKSEDSVSARPCRIWEDYDLISCLGRGGYGVVFEARNKILEHNYAIKRILLPKNHCSRERLLRECKALAKLDHPNIVRLLTAWLESTPPDFLDEQDKLWVSHKNLNQNDCMSPASIASDSVHIEVPPSDPPSVDSACEAYDSFANNKFKRNSQDSYVVVHSSEYNCDNKTNKSYRIETTESVHLSISEESKDDGTDNTDNTDLSIVFEHSENVNQGLDHSINFEHSNYESDSASDSIVFAHSENVNQGLDHSINFEHSNHESDNASDSIVFAHSTKKSLSERKSQLNLDLKKPDNSGKYEKMFLYIQMQLCQKTTLREWLKSENRTRDSVKIFDIFQQIVEGVEYVHLQGMIHRDLKPSNIFFGLDDRIKIGDFGLVTSTIAEDTGVRTPSMNAGESNTSEKLHTAKVGTHLYMSPEQMNGKHYNYKVDIYSLGIILFELLIPFDTEMERAIELTNLRRSIFPNNFSQKYPAEYDLLKMMLDTDPEKRPTTLGIKARSPFLKNRIQNISSNDEDTKWHFELPLISRHSSISNSSNSENRESSS